MKLLKNIDKYLIQNKPLLWLSRFHFVLIASFIFLSLNMYLLFNFDIFFNYSIFYILYTILLLPVLFLLFRFQYINFQPSFNANQVYKLFLFNVSSFILLFSTAFSLPLFAEKAIIDNLKEYRQKDLRKDFYLLELASFDKSLLLYCKTKSNNTFDTIENHSLLSLCHYYDDKNVTSPPDSLAFIKFYSDFLKYNPSTFNIENQIDEITKRYPTAPIKSKNLYANIQYLENTWNRLISVKLNTFSSFAILYIGSIFYGLTVLFWISSKKIITIFCPLISATTAMTFSSLPTLISNRSDMASINFNSFIYIAAIYAASVLQKKKKTIVGSTLVQINGYNFVFLYIILLINLYDNLELGPTAPLTFQSLVLTIPFGMTIVMIYVFFEKYTMYLQLPGK